MSSFNRLNYQYELIKDYKNKKLTKEEVEEILKKDNYPFSFEEILADEEAYNETIKDYER